MLELSTEEAMTNFSEDDEEFARYQDAHEMYTQYGEHGMDGWDYSRALQVLGGLLSCRLYQSGRMSGSVSSDRQKKLQSAFTSWEELADSYIYGYAFWQNETADDVETKFRIQAYAELVEMENSPYSVAYDTKLENTGKMGRNGKKNAKRMKCQMDMFPSDVQIQKVFRYVFRKNMCLTKKIMKSMKIPNLPNHVGMETASISVIRQNFWMTGTMQNCQKKYWTEGNAQEKENAEKKGGTYEAGEIKSLSVKEDLTVFYLAEKEVTEGGTQQISYQAVAEVGGKYLVKCYISDVASPGYELMLGMNEEALIKELFSDFRW